MKVYAVCEIDLYNDRINNEQSVVSMYRHFEEAKEDFMSVWNDEFGSENSDDLLDYHEPEFYEDGSAIASFCTEDRDLRLTIEPWEVR